MKNTIILATFFLFCFQLQSQNVEFTYFNKTYGGNDTINILAQAIQPVEDGFLVFGNYGTTTIAYGLYCLKTDKYGSFQWLKKLDETQTFQQMGISMGTQVITVQDNIILLYGKQKNINVIKLDFLANVIWHAEFETTTWQSGQMIIPAYDGGFVIGGLEQNTTADTVKAYALKIDSMGNYEWDKRYLMGNDARFFTVQHTPWDGGYIFGGMGYSTSTGYDMFVVKTLANGDTLWTKRYGNEFSNCAALVIPFISHDEYLNGAAVEYIMTSCWHDSSNPWQSKNYIAKINSIGNIIWEKKHTNYAPFASLQTFPYITPDKHIVGAAAYYQSGNWSPVVISYNSNGSIEWSKPFTINSQKDCYIKDLQPTPDGGYVLAGYQFTAPQTAWVLKIDAQGNTCSYVGCDSTITIIVHTTPPFSGRN